MEYWYINTSIWCKICGKLLTPPEVKFGGQYSETCTNCKMNEILYKEHKEGVMNEKT